MRITADISNEPVTEVDRQKQTKLVDAAQQFEASMLQELLKPMHGQQDGWGDTEEKDTASDTISGFGAEAMAKAISKRGGFGIAKQVISQVNREHDGVTKKNPQSTEVSVFSADTFK
jgi:peptidoglycan hydrolase FlgJ